jgi:serine/threonine protein kinase
MMQSLSPFCDACGASNSQQATHCFACRQPLHSASPPLSVQDPSNHPALAPVPPGGALLPGSQLVRRYQVVDQIGQGGFGLVFKAQDRQQKHKLVAIKEINLRALNVEEIIEVTDSYNREVTLLSKLDHANLPHIYDHFTDPEHWYLVMDFIEGQTLEDYLKKKRRGSLRVKEVLSIGITLCSVLGYLHTQRPPIIFRDLKPANIMRTPRGRLYLIDFGIARHFTPGQARDTGPLGSPGYAAPEQYGKAQTTVQTDIYGLGATLQTLLTGEEPSPLRATTYTSRYGKRKKLQQLLRQMLERDASHRPKNIDEVKNRLQRIKGGIVGPIAKQALALFLGLLIGSMPYSLLFLLYFSQFTLSLQSYFESGPAGLLLLGLLCSWPLFFLVQLALGIKWCLSSGKRLRGLGILSMMLFINIAVLFAWPIGLPPFH